MHRIRISQHTNPLSLYKNKRLFNVSSFFNQKKMQKEKFNPSEESSSPLNFSSSFKNFLTNNSLIRANIRSPMTTVTDYDYLYKSNSYRHFQPLILLLVLLIGDVRVGKTSFLTKFDNFHHSSSSFNL